MSAIEPAAASGGASGCFGRPDIAADLSATAR
jgi:hypothetical protein